MAPNARSVHVVQHVPGHQAVIGAGPAGLAVAHELLKEGHTVTVFEAGPAVGGAWHFDSSIDSDPLGLDPNRTKVHSSMYAALRTNLPRQLMTFLDFPFTPNALGGKSSDPRMHPSHTEVLAYLHAFADAFDLHRHVLLNTHVLRIDPITEASSISGAGSNDFQAQGDSTEEETTLHDHAHIISSSSMKTTGRTAAAAATATAAAALLPLTNSNGMKWRVITESSKSSSVESSCSNIKPSHQTAVAAETPSVQVSKAVHCCADSHQSDVQRQTSKQQQQQQTSQQQQQQQQQEWEFDAVACCVGIFSEPNLPQVASMHNWPGLQLHSHNYRDAQQFKGQRVLVVGASFSGEEIARAIADVAAQVYQAARTFTGPGTARERPLKNGHQQQRQQQQQQQKQDLGVEHEGFDSSSIPTPAQARQNIQRLPMLQQLLPDGAAVFQDGQVVRDLDAIVYCTGYKISYPWMEHLNLVQTDNGHVRPLYLHMFPPAAAPSLCLIGLPWRCAKMPQFQLQGQLLARVLSGRALLPSQAEMLQEQQQLFDAMAAGGIPRRYTHCMANFMPQNEWQYADTLTRLAAGSSSDLHRQQQGDIGRNCEADKAGLSSQSSMDAQAEEQLQQQQQLLVMPEWLQALACAFAGDILGRPDSFRDAPSDEVESLMQQAEQAMVQMLPSPAKGCFQ